MLNFQKLLKDPNTDLVQQFIIYQESSLLPSLGFSYDFVMIALGF